MPTKLATAERPQNADLTTKPEYQRVSSAVVHYGLSRATLYRYAQQKRITVYKVFGNTFLKTAELEALFQPQTDQN